MQGWMKKNQKKLLAVMGAFLMVSFLISVPVGSLTAGSRGHGPAVGKVGKTVIYADEKSSLENEWKILSKLYYYDSESQRPSFKPAVYAVGPAIASQMNEHPELFMLLVKEAEQRGIKIPDALIRTAVETKYRSFGEVGGPEVDAAVGHLLMVKALRDELISDAKFSEAQWKHGIALQNRNIRVAIVEYNAEQIAQSTPAPTTQQVQAIYDQSKDILPDAPRPPTADVAFAYKVPDRVKLQYVSIARDQILKAAREAQRHDNDKPGEVPYDLKVKALEYYMRNKAEFVRPAPETQPATKPATGPADFNLPIPATQPTTAASTQLSATTQPTTQPATSPTTVAATEPAKLNEPTARPFAEVQDEIITKILKPDADALETKVADAVKVKLAAASAAADKAGPATQPTTRPATDPADIAAGITAQPPGRYSFADLEKIRAEIQQQFNVSIEITQVADWQDAKTLMDLHGIGESESDKTPFARFVFTSTAPFVTSPARKISALQVGQASNVFADFHENDYLFRLTDASPSHAPDLASIEQRVTQDARLKAAFEHANVLAKEFLDDAKKEGFNTAAVNSKRQVILSGEFNPMTSRGVPNFLASPAATPGFLTKVKELADEATAANPTPMAIIPMPADHRVVIVQVVDISLQTYELALYEQRFGVERYHHSQSEQLSQDYFNYDKVVKRLDYKPEAADKSGS